MPANLENSAVATGLEDVSFHPNSKESQCQRMFKLLHNCTHLTCSQSKAQNSPSQASTVHELWTSRCSNWIRKGRGTRDQIANIHWIIEKARESQKNIYFCFIDYTKAFVWITANCGKFCGQRWEYQITWPASWEICMQVKKQHFKSDLEQQTCSKSGKEYIKAIYCHPAYLTCLQST